MNTTTFYVNDLFRGLITLNLPKTIYDYVNKIIFQIFIKDKGKVGPERINYETRTPNY